MRENAYKMEGRIRLSEVDHNRRMRLQSIINWMQDTGTQQSEVSGVGFEYSNERGKAWILAHWQVIVEEYPKLDDKIEVYTWASGFEKFLGYRNYCIVNEEGKMIVKASAVWVYMDIRKGRPTFPDPHEMEVYGIGEPLEMPYTSRKVAMSLTESMKLPAFPVRRSDIDTNEHVNNSQYIRMALDVLPEEITCSEIRVEYKKSAVLGDVIYPEVTYEEERTLVVLKNADGKVFAAIELFV